ncbi:hypothetical protein FIV42_07470 [Persicimonas caeni]|uniref:Uncharacterized protein n=1 Tax=Persicimonas caeni TaxID=2292766 RepID=A0A4Y6PQI5_PERCE|nr:hypothetical protein [Persicimonas caeni]QDG50578.1 hypothetical protein FIV42_07470 [Persicimonas caeni]QED31799.1 hypothetical protein FRD00_07465 [Persicimonas caeni]
MSAQSIQIINRTKQARVVADAGEVHAPKVVAELAGELDGLAGFDGAQLVPMTQAGVLLLLSVTDEMEELDMRYASECAQDEVARARRDVCVAEARKLVMDARDHTRSTLGEGGPSKYGLPSVTPRQPDRLLAELDNVLHRLEEYPVRQSGHFGATFDSAAMHEEVSRVRDDLAVALDTLGIERRETERAMLERDAAVARWERIYRGVAGQLSSLFIMAGHDELAKRVRPTTRRAAGLDAPSRSADAVEA